MKPPLVKGLKGQRGIILVELMIGALISIVVLSMLSSGIAQMFTGSGALRGRLTAVDEVARAAQVMTPDLQMAQSTACSGTTPNQQITVTYIDGATGASKTVVYSRLSGGILQRTLNGVVQLPLARSVTSLSFTCNGKVTTVTVISAPSGSIQGTTTSTWQVTRRPS